MKKRIMAIVLCMCMILSMLPTTASAASETVKVTVAGVDDHTRSAEMFELINAQREADNIPRVRRSATLTDLAMQRAAELVLYYKANHTRPDGSAYTTLIDGVYTGWTEYNESIAINMEAAEDVLAKWMETAADQHNIRNDAFTQVGIGCFYSGGTYCWAVLFGNSTTETEFTTIDGTPVARRPVTIQSNLLRLSPNGQKTIDVEVDAFDSFQITAANSGYVNTFPVLVPKAKDALDEEGNLIAQLTIAGNGTISVTGVAPGTGTTEVSVYTGQTDPLKLIVNVTGAAATEPTESTPTEPDPTESQPTEPEPTEPEVTEPKPTEPEPTEPEPTEPEPTEPKPTEPEPTEPAPEKPEGKPDDSGTWGENLTWELYDTTLYISGKGEMEHSKTDNMPWYEYRKSVQSVSISDGVTSVATGAFQDFSKLTSVYLPGSITSIGNSAFWGCSSLTAIEIPEKVNLIGYYAFQDCSNLTGIHVHKNNASYSSDASGVLFNKEKTTLIVAPGAMKSYVIPSTVTSIQEHAFSSCGRLVSVVLPDNLTSIEPSVFCNCVSLTTIDIPAGITSIGSFAFSRCESLSEITFFGNAPSIETDTFNDVTATAYYPAGNSTWTSDVMQDYGGALTWVSYDPETTDPTEPKPTEPDPTEPDPTEPKPTEPEPTEPAPSRPEGEPDDSGTWDDNLTWALYDTTLYISGKGDLFAGESGDSKHPLNKYNTTITAIVLEEGIASIGSNAFSGLSNLETVSLPGTLRLIDTNAFAESGLREITIPAGVEKVLHNAFGDCTKLEKVVFEGTNLELGANCFKGCTSLKSVALPSALKYLPGFCFENCEKLTSIDLPDSIEIIDILAFQNAGLTTLELPGSLTTIYASVFSGCPLTEVEIPENVTAIGDGAFEFCTDLKTVVLHDSLLSIGASAFADTALVTVYLPDSVTSIGHNAFQNCADLETIRIPDSATALGNRIFNNAPNVTIECYMLSVAHLYALNDGIPVEILEEDPSTPVYPIDLTVGDGGNVEISSEESPANRYVLIVAEPEEGYRLDAIYYDYDSDQELDLQFQQVSDTEFAFFMPACAVELEFCFAPTDSPFTDVKESDYFYEPVLWAVSRGVTSGVSANRFGPNNACTRAQVVMFLWRAAGSPEPTSQNNPFTDVKETDYFYKAVLWAVENGITAGVSDTRFGSKNVCTRAQVVTFLWRACGSVEPTSYDNPFTDVKETDYFYKAVLFAVEYGITSGMSATRFGSGNTCTRAHVVTFLYKTVNG